MRAFSEDEEKILSRLDELAGTSEQQKKGEINPVSLYSLIQLKLDEAGFVVDITSNTVTVIFENDLHQNSARLGALQLIIVQSVNLLKLLEDKGYIYTFKKDISLNLIPFGKYNFTNPSAPYSFSDKRIVELVIKYSTEEIYPTFELNHFVKIDKFQTRESARFSKQFKRTTTALIVAIVALLANITFNIYTNFLKPNDNKVIAFPPNETKIYDTPKNNHNFEIQDSLLKYSTKSDSGISNKNKKP